MTTTHASVSSDSRPAQLSKAQQAQIAFADMLAEASRRGFHGTLSLSLIVQDGRIQYLRVNSDRKLR